MADRIKIYCGTEPKTYIAQRVLEHSIKSNTHFGDLIDFTPMIGPEWEYSRDGIKVGTGFSLRRWMIPAACGWQGRAIYLDADQLVFGDIAELLQYTPLPDDAVIGCTSQVDKYSPKTPVPQTSVMWIDCEAAKLFDFFKIEEILDYLRKNVTAQDYGKLMHGEWLGQRIAELPTEWNHLNTYDPKRTRLLHYTKEPEQPWYKPDHPLAPLWQKALVAAMADGYVTQDDLRDALSKWNVKEDWRNTNGLHPFYKKYLTQPKAAATVKAAAPAERESGARRKAKTQAKILWVTSFAQDMYEASGKQLIETFIRNNVVGDLLLATESVVTILNQPKNILHHHLEDDTYLTDWLKHNEDVIPQHLGGKHPGTCACPGGPFDIHDKRHTLPCLGYWFNRNASRWFRKIAAQRVAVSIAELHNYDTLIWIDADSRFKKTVTEADVAAWFKTPQTAAFCLKNKRPIMESGVLGFRLKLDGHSIIRDVVECYRSGDFRRMKRWDDSAVYQWFFDRAQVPVVDIAYGVGDHAAVVPHSLLNPFLAHDKGKHGRKLGIMK